MLVFSVTPFKKDQNENQNRSIDKVQNLGDERRSYVLAFIDQITTESGMAARIESHGAHYIQATHLQQNSDVSKLNDKSKLSISNKVNWYNYQSTISN